MAQSVIGGPYTAADETTVYASSGLVSPGATAPAFMTLLNFPVRKDIIWEGFFSWNGEVSGAGNDAVGLDLGIGPPGSETSIIYTAYRRGSTVNTGRYVDFKFFQPTGTSLLAQFINVDLNASPSLNVNLTLVGKILTPKIEGIAAVDSSRTLGSAAKYVPAKTPSPSQSYPDADLFPDVPSVPTSSLFGRSKSW